ncbi:MAG TPA: hypothetical protein VMU15_22220 [Anaeromyxobacter sp.]|nr:hypothetical protein [Anaeromyxobacter sp.]
MDQDADLATGLRARPPARGEPPRLPELLRRLLPWALLAATVLLAVS